MNRLWYKHTQSQHKRIMAPQMLRVWRLKTETIKRWEIARQKKVFGGQKNVYRATLGNNIAVNNSAIGAPECFLVPDVF